MYAHLKCSDEEGAKFLEPTPKSVDSSPMSLRELQYPEDFEDEEYFLSTGAEQEFDQRLSLEVSGL